MALYVTFLLLNIAGILGGIAGIGIRGIVRNRLIMHAAFIRITQKLHQTVGRRHNQVFDRVALFRAAVIVGLITCVRGARDGTFRTVVKKGVAASGAGAAAVAVAARVLVKASSRSWSVATVRVGGSPLVASAARSAVNKTCNQRLAFGWVNPNAAAWAVCNGAPLRYIKTNNTRSSGVGNGQLAYWLERRPPLSWYTAAEVTRNVLAQVSERRCGSVG